MPAGERITVDAESYGGKLKNLEDGSKIEMHVQGHIENQKNGQISIIFDSVDLNMDNSATRSLKDMLKQDGEAAYAGGSSKEEDEF